MTSSLEWNTSLRVKDTSEVCKTDLGSTQNNTEKLPFLDGVCMWCGVYVVCVWHVVWCV